MLASSYRPARLAPRAVDLIVATALVLAAVLTNPSFASAENEFVFSEATTSPTESTVNIYLTGDPDTTYYVSVYAAPECDAIVAPENFVVEVAYTTDDEFGEAFGSEAVAPAIPAGWVVTSTLATTAGGTPAFVSEECAEVTQEGLYPLGLRTVYLVEPDRDRLILDFTPEPDAICESSLDAGSVPDTADFTATLDGAPIGVASVEFAAGPCPATLTLDLAGALPSGQVQLAYTPGASPIQNQAGDPADEFERIAQERASATIAAGASLSTDGEGDGATATDPLETIVTTAALAGGAVTIVDGTEGGISGAGPELFLPLQVGLDAPDGSAAQPISVEFVIDAAVMVIPGTPFTVDPSDLSVYRHGEKVQPCVAGAGAAANPEPCESARSEAGDDLRLTIRTASTGFTWTFGHNPGATDPEPSGEPVTVGLPDLFGGGSYATITFPGVTGSGQTSFNSEFEPAVPPVPPNFGLGDPAEYFDVSTTATFDPPAEVCILYQEWAYADEIQIRLLHLEDDEWVDVTTSLDTDADLVCGSVMSFSPFVIATGSGDVNYTFTGFTGDVANPPAVNRVNAGDKVRLRFSLGGDYGFDVFADGFPSSVRVPCAGEKPFKKAQEASPTNGVLHYNDGRDRYRYAWKTREAWAGTCRQVTLAFADGDVATAIFKFR